MTRRSGDEKGPLGDALKVLGDVLRSQGANVAVAINVDKDGEVTVARSTDGEVVVDAGADDPGRERERP